jgi:hypothetical protein
VLEDSAFGKCPVFETSVSCHKAPSSCLTPTTSQNGKRWDVILAVAIVLIILVYPTIFHALKYQILYKKIAADVDFLTIRSEIGDLKGILVEKKNDEKIYSPV